LRNRTERPHDHPNHPRRRRTPGDPGAGAPAQEHEDVEIIDKCSNGREAIRAIKTHKPDLVFLDIQMPGFDGFSVVQGLMEVEPPLFVFVTAYSTTPSAPSRRRRWII
jgi:CheY-like chemotaxis protein